jgi:hypothetical protein
MARPLVLLPSINGDGKPKALASSQLKKVSDGYRMLGSLHIAVSSISGYLNICTRNFFDNFE